MAVKWIDNVNRKLDRCQVVQMSGRQALYLIASLPGKTAPDKRQQQRIPLGLKVDDVGSSEKAKKLAFRLEDQLEEGSFKWADWDKDKLRYSTNDDGFLTMDQFRSLAQEAFEIKAARGDYKNPDEYFKVKWQPLLNKLADHRGSVTNEWIQVFLNTQTQSNKQMHASVLSQIVEVKALKRFGLDQKEIQSMGRGYGKSDQKTVVIPSDEELLSAIDGVRVPHWHWMCAMLFVYGLRDREVADCHFGTHPSSNGNLLELDVRQSKTGRRVAYPLEGTEQWIKDLDLMNIKRPTNAKGQEYGYTKQLVQAAAQALTSNKKDGRGYPRRPKLNFKLYTFRHAYALRGDALGYSIEDMASSMGHTARQHEDTYKQWLGDRQRRARGDRMMSRLSDG
tara:strand:+ start:157 stop:1335 length:1179 start_codon:yes stop_codon:yes gene_type:complete